MNRIAIIHSSDVSPTIRRAIDFLSEFILDLTLDFPFCFSTDDVMPDDVEIKIYVGTNMGAGTASFDSPEQYYISVKDNNVIIDGSDDVGVLYGVMDFYNKYLISRKYANTDVIAYDVFSTTLTDFSLMGSPSVRERGIWTWGHVIYDYKRFLDNMARLKLNSIVMWNDFLPFNIKEIIDYAHILGIKIILGYSWGWDQGCKDISLSTLSGMEKKIFEKHKREYSGLDIDGIYFQTVTELSDEYIEGVLVADAVTSFVNRTCDLFYNEYPDLLIEFGLHATSVKNRLSIIKNVDKRVRIVWEDLGSMPFSYSAHAIDNYETTLELVKETATLRGEDDNYGVVPKSLTFLDWSTFVHPKGAQNIGVSTEYVRENRIIRKRRAWRKSVAGWLKNGELAQRAIAELCKIKGGSFSVNALLEDGMFEEQIMYPIALLSEILWNPFGDYGALVSDVTLRDYVSFT